MKLRASFFNGTVFRKNLTRFAPCWGLCTLFWGITIFLTAVDATANYFVKDVVNYIPGIIGVNAAYAFLVAQLLFGDLYQSRLCGGLHCLPLRRECWFVTDLVSGLVFELIPMGVTALLVAIFGAGCNFTGAFMVAPLLLLAAMLSYICFFGLAVLASFCVGNRFAAVVVYGLLNFGAALVYCLLEMFYVPDYYGVVIQFDPFQKFCPIVQSLAADYLDCTVIRSGGVITDGTVLMQAGWNWLCIYAGVGVVALTVSLLMYRRRHLEKAGDFIAVKCLEPVFLLVYTLCVALMFSMFWEISELKFFVYLGVAVGYFTGRMFLKRTTRVFQWKAVAGCGLAMLVLGLSFAVNRLDPFGIESRIPEEGDVQCAYVTEYGAYWLTSDSRSDSVIRLEDAEGIADVRRLHELALEDHAEFGDSGQGDQSGFAIGYTLKDGSKMVREYTCYVNSEAGDILRSFLSSTEYVLDLTPEQAMEGSRYYEPEIFLYGTTLALTTEQMDALVAAIAADCQEGNMVNNAAFHDTSFVGYVELCRDGEYDWRYTYLEIYEDCTHVVEFLEENDLMQYMSEWDYQAYTKEYTTGIVVD